MARIDILLKHPGSMKSWLEKGDGKTFNEYIVSWREDEMKSLRKESNPVEFHRSQGRLEVLERILGLRDEINTFLESKRKTDK